MKHSLAAALLAAGVLSLGGLAFAVGTASASAGHCNPSDPQCPIGSLITGPPPLALPGNCPSWLSAVPWSLDFTDGNAVLHGTSNKNGDWGGVTAEGPAALTTSGGTVVQYAGHATEWGGGGNNSGGQTEGGFTLTFHGSGIAGTIDIHIDGHSTTNNAGVQTNNFMNVSVTCS